ncbi:MAG: serine hydrolase, partial [Lachnospiraceae bacterium]|nr:serine hydrolase [Lachnospiraceae bacterium]
MKFGKRIAGCFLLCALLAFLCFACGSKELVLEPVAISGTEAETLSGNSWQASVAFPDWKGYTDDTLAMNSMYSFFGYHGQGNLYVKSAKEVESFRMYVNGRAVNMEEASGGNTISVNIADVAVDGMNTVQISNIKPAELTEAVHVYIPFPEVIKGTPEEEGINPKALDLISDLIETDIENGFTSAQLSIVRNGRLVYENAWGRTNSYLPDGSPCTDSPMVTTDTLYDLASVTKMFSVNYAIQKLVADEKLSLDDKITDFLGDGFVSETMLVVKEKSEDQEPEPELSLEDIKEWKAKLTVRDLLRHQGGFPADP